MRELGIRCPPRDGADGITQCSYLYGGDRAMKAKVKAGQWETWRQGLRRSMQGVRDVFFFIWNYYTAQYSQRWRDKLQT